MTALQVLQVRDENFLFGRAPRAAPEPYSLSSVGAGSLMRVRAWPRSLPRRQRLSRALSAVAGGPVAELRLPRVHTALSRDIGATPGQRLVVSVRER